MLVSVVQAPMWVETLKKTKHEKTMSAVQRCRALKDYFGVYNSATDWDICLDRNSSNRLSGCRKKADLQYKEEDRKRT